MIAKNDYYLDADGKVTTDPANAARRLVRKGSTVGGVIEKRYKFIDGEPTSMDPLPIVGILAPSAPHVEEKPKPEKEDVKPPAEKKGPTVKVTKAGSKKP